MIDPIDIVTERQLAMIAWMKNPTQDAWNRLIVAEAAEDEIENQHREQMLLATSRPWRKDDYSED